MHCAVEKAHNTYCYLSPNTLSSPLCIFLKAVQANEFVLFVLDPQSSPCEVRRITSLFLQNHDRAHPTPAEKTLVQYTDDAVQPLLSCAVREGDTIPGYVAFTRNIVNLNILAEVRPISNLHSDK